jgi:nitrogen fixation/metabolism regulation signal transduction histidine kinase
MRLRWTLEARLAVLLVTLMLLTAGAAVGIERLLGPTQWAPLAYAALGIAAVLLGIWVAHRAFRPVHGLLRAVTGAVASYRDGDFSFSLRVDCNDEFGELRAAHNELGQALREQRDHLVHRELLLDTVTQNSPVALVLVGAYQNVVYANLAARGLLGDGRSLTGRDFTVLLARAPGALRDAAATGEDTLFAVELEGEEETFHLSQRGFLLQGVPHRLYLLKRLTRELSRQEVATWKKLIRVMSHEMNNSLAPIASLAQSGTEMLRRGSRSELAGVFATIAERAQSLHQFISGYAAFAKLPAPRSQRVSWSELLEELARHQPFRLSGDLPTAPGWFDRSQIEQALINLLKNAHEAGGPAAEVELAISQAGAEERIEVLDRGPGMSEGVLAHALLPFYSTKRYGTGLGLALTREIAEAHGGRVRLANREGGGLCVTLILPLPAEQGRV